MVLLKQQKELYEGSGVLDEDALYRALRVDCLDNFRWMVNNVEVGGLEAEDIFHEAYMLFVTRLKNERLVLSCSWGAFFMGILKNKWYTNYYQKMRCVEKEAFQAIYPSVVREHYGEPERRQTESLLYRKYFYSLDYECRKIISLLLRKIMGKDIAELYGYNKSTFVRRRKYCFLTLIQRIKKDPVFKHIQI